MKFNLTLDESLFDDASAVDSAEFSLADFDDDFSEYDEHSVENVLPGPETNTDNGVANVLINLINDEWEAIQGYNDAIVTLKSYAAENSFYANAVKVLEEISAEENVHVGQLQEVLKRISPNAADIQKGTEEAKSQLEFRNGLLQVESWDSYNQKHAQQSTNVNQIDETCTLADIDDDM